MILPNHDKLFPLPLSRPGQTPAPHPILVMEMRGWIRYVAPICEAKDPGWYYALEPDPEWLDEKGIKLEELLRVGNLTGLGDERDQRSVRAVAARPLIRIEFGGWDLRRKPRRPPAGWRYMGAPGCPDVVWAFNPTNPVKGQPALVPGQYVRIVGALVMDMPHATKAVVGVWLLRHMGFSLGSNYMVYGTQNFWSQGGEHNPSNPARWTEIHPPDSIEVLPAKPMLETLRGIAVGVEPGFFFPRAQTFEFRIAPPGPRPSPEATIEVREVVLSRSGGAESTEGRVSAISTDAAEARVAIHLRSGVRGQGPARFAALYRVFWKDPVRQ